MMALCMACAVLLLLFAPSCIRGLAPVLDNLQAACPAKPVYITEAAIGVNACGVPVLVECRDNGDPAHTLTCEVASE